MEVIQIKQVDGRVGGNQSYFKELLGQSKNYNCGAVGTNIRIVLDEWMNEWMNESFISLKFALYKWEKWDQWISMHVKMAAIQWHLIIH